MNKDIYKKSMALFERAVEVIPGGIYGHNSPATVLPGASPYYAESAQGCRYTDVDGREYLDFMCAYGPIILGYKHPEVEEAVAKQMRDGNCFNHPTSLMVELAEYLVDRVDFADWAVFGKNGSDMTSWALQVARESTQRKKILHVDGSYHGAHPWCTPGHAGLIEEDRAHVHTFAWNDLEMFNELVAKYKDEVAALIITPYHHPAFADSVMPKEGFLQAMEATCRESGIIIILDDIRAGFRLHHGGSHRYFDFQPDIICFCKAIANGYPISAALGRGSLKNVASKVFLTGSYWNSAVPMAAALKCTEVLERENVVDYLKNVGNRLTSGLERIGKKHNAPIICSGPPAIPFMRFKDENNYLRQQEVCATLMEDGVFLHPHHNWFLSAAHSESDVDEVLEKFEDALTKS